MEKTIPRAINTLLFCASFFVTNFAESKINNNACSEEMKWLIAKPLQMQEYALLNASRKIFEKFLEVNSQKNVTSKDQLWAYKILSIGNHILKEQPIKSSRIKNITSGFSDSATQIIKGTVDFEDFKLQIKSLTQQAEAISKELYAEKSTFLEEDRKQIDAVYKCVLITAMYSASTKSE